MKTIGEIPFFDPPDLSQVTTSPLEEIYGGCEITVPLAAYDTEPCQDNSDGSQRGFKRNWGSDREGCRGGKHRSGSVRKLSKVKAARRKNKRV